MKNQSLFERAQRSIPAGVNSPVRAFRAVGGAPPFFERAAGAYLWDAEGKRYIDYVASWGPMVAGHTHPAVVKAVQDAAARALSFGAPTEAEVAEARAHFIGRLVTQRQSNEELTAGLAEQWLWHGRILPVDEQRAAIEGVTRAGVLRAVEGFRRGRIAVVAVGKPRAL